MVTVTKYASTIEPFSDARFQVEEWLGLANATNDTNLSADSSYAYRGGQKYVPQQLYCHDFDVTLPDDFNLKEIRFEVKLRGENVDAVVPMGYFFYLGGLGHIGATYSDDVYRVQPSQKIPSSFSVVDYVMGQSDIVVNKLNREKIEKDNFGLILQFNENAINEQGNVYVEWVRLVLNYDIPSFVLEIQGNCASTKYDAIQHSLEVWDKQKYTFKVHNTNYLTSSPKTVQINVPLGLELMGYETSHNAVFNPNTYELTVDFKKGLSPYVILDLRARTTGIKALNITGDMGSLTKYLQVNKPVYDFDESDDRMYITSGDVRRWSESCFHFATKAYSEDTVVGYDVFINTMDSSTNQLIEWKLDEDKSSDGVSVDWQFTNQGYIQFNVPAETEVEIYFTGCFLPKETGAGVVTVESQDTGHTWTYDYVALEPYTYIFELGNHDINIVGGRLVSQVETGAYVYPVGVSEYDDDLIIDSCSLHMDKFNDIDYIGCVPLKVTHYDPKSTYKDTLLNTQYKNKRYMGKKGAVDETITLNIKLPPQDVTTIQGLVDMDKPVPINTNHLAFEGDSLNHRGWVELYNITAKQVGNNPHWYDADISVKYITHNLNSRFSINKGSRVSDYFLPELLLDKHEYGADLKDSFLVECTGGYTYNKSEPDYHKRNFFGLPNQKKLVLRGLNKLSVKSQINLNWYTSRNVENVHNNISHIIRLIDSETGNAVLEYEYYDIDFTTTGRYNCRVICRILYKGAYKTVLNRNFILNSDAEFDSSQAGEIDVYGSEIIFKIVNDKVTIQDAGFSGKELVIEDIDIQNGQYYFDVEFDNNNTQNDAPAILNYLDVAIKELDLTSKYTNYYQNLLVSPFPVPNKTVVFTRECDEGTIYYLEDDGTECSYMLNPYYSYLCGVDLETRDGISIFNIDNNYHTIYITNGLVKLGINRFNGKVTLYKYDKHSKNFILTNHFQLTKYEDINLNSYTDDKIELQASDCIFTMWRGRPYILINHETEDILFTDKWVRVYSDGIGDYSSETPNMWSLIDATNLLPSKLASDRGIDASAWELETDGTDAKSGSTSISLEHEGGLSDASVFTSSTTLSNADKLVFLVDGAVVEPTDDDALEYQFVDAGVHTVQAVYTSSSGYSYSDKLSLTVEDNGYKITPTFPSSMYYLQDDFTCTLTYDGDPVADETVVFYVNGLSYPKLTDENGVARLNNSLPPREQLVDPDITGDDDIEHQTQSDRYMLENIPYKVVITYREGGEVVATAEKDCLVMKGYVTTTPSSTTIVRTNPITFTFTNGLDPNDDDIIDGEQYVVGSTVVLSVNGRDYPRVTTSSGTASLTINLPVGTYDLKVKFAGDNHYNGFIRNYEINVVE